MTLREIQDHDAFIAAVRAGTLADRVIQGVFVGGIDLADCDVHGAVFVGCTVSTSTHIHLIEHGALVFPVLSGLPLPHLPYLHPQVRGAWYPSSNRASEALRTRSHAT